MKTENDNLSAVSVISMSCRILLCYGAALYSGLAIDIGRQKLYYADEATAGGKVGELSTDGTAHRILDYHKTSKPFSVVIDVNNRFGMCQFTCICRPLRYGYET